MSTIRESWLRSQMEERAPGTEGPVATHMIGTNTYFAKVYSLKDFIADEVRANADAPLGPDQDSTDFLTAQAMLQREKKFSSQYLNSAAWTLSADGDAARSPALDFSSAANNNIVFWSSATSTPVEDIRTMKRAVQLRTRFPTQCACDFA